MGGERTFAAFGFSRSMGSCTVLACVLNIPSFRMRDGNTTIDSRLIADAGQEGRFADAVGFGRAPRELFCFEPGKLQWRDIEPVKLSSTQVRLDFRHGAAKNGTERMLYRGQVFERGDYDSSSKMFRRDHLRSGFRPYVAGNLTVSEIVEVGAAVHGFASGDLILSRGGFRERHVVDVGRIGELDVRRIPPGLDWQSAVCLDPTMFALAALRDGHVRLGDAIAIFGLGALGLAAVQLAKAVHAGLVIAIDPIGERRAIAAALGADVVIDPTRDDAGELVRKHNHGKGMDVTVEMSGSVDGMQAAIRSTDFGGTVVAAAAPPRYESGIDIGGDAHFNCINFVFSRGCSEPNREHPRWSMQRLYDVSWSLICSRAVRGNRIVDPIVEFDSLAETYEMILDGNRALKLGVRLRPAQGGN